MKRSRKPNLFLIGAPKCGTTSLSAYLRTHPDVFFSTPKEPNFFSTDLPRVEMYADTAAYLQKCFNGLGTQSVIAEGSTTYLRSTEAVPNILRFNPSAKFIVMLRHPADIACSLFHHFRRTGREPDTNFATAWENRVQRQIAMRSWNKDWQLPPPDYGTICALGSQMARLYERVVPNRVFVVLFDDFITETQAVYEQVLGFLNLPVDGRTNFPAKNQRAEPRFDLVRDTILRLGAIKRRLGLKRVHLGLLNRLLRLNEVPAKYEPLSDDLRDTLTHFFANDIETLRHVLATQTPVDNKTSNELNW